MYPSSGIQQRIKRQLWLKFSKRFMTISWTGATASDRSCGAASIQNTLEYYELFFYLFLHMKSNEQNFMNRLSDRLKELFTQCDLMAWEIRGWRMQHVVMPRSRQTWKKSQKCWGSINFILTHVKYWLHILFSSFFSCFYSTYFCFNYILVAFIHIRCHY